MSSLVHGSRVGAYGVLGSLGAGGMGEVYRATDTRLGREVALKLLPADFADDPERHARFEREAKLLASLNHPNIATLFGLEHLEAAYSSQPTADSSGVSDPGSRTPDPDTGGTSRTFHVLVMELVEGESLEQRLERGAVPVEEAIPIAVQIAEALEAAHEKGIVHRDLKPANIRIRPDGAVKVLDFGLAKAWADEDSASIAHSPTLTSHRTQAGLIIGTAAYMAPEQARGKPVDRRADIWAFGVVLYEMLTGRKLFDGETVTDVLAAVVRQEVDWATLPRELPDNVVGTLRRCLDRDPRRRLRDIGEARIALAASPAPTPARDAVSLVPGAAWTRRSFALASAMAGVGAVVGFGLGRRTARPAAAGVVGTGLEITRLTSSGNVIAAAVSPDCRYIAYVESDQGLQSLWLRQIATGQTLRLIPERPVFYWGHAFSPDGNSVVFGLKTPEDSAGGLYSISALGGTARRLLSGIDATPAFSRDGKRVAYLRRAFPSGEESALMVAGADGSDPKPLAVFRLPEYVAPIFYAGPTWAPDGSRVVTAVGSLGSVTADARARLVSVAVADGSVANLADPGWPQAGQAGFLPDGRGLLVIARGPHQPNPQIWHVASPGGEAAPVTNDLDDHRIISLSSDGRSLVSVSGDVSSAVWVGPRDGSERPRRRTWAKLDGFKGVCFAPGGRIVYATDDGGVWGVWTMTADGGERAPLAATQPGEFVLAVAVSGRGDVFMSVRTRAGVEVRVAGADGGSPRVVARDLWAAPTSVSRGGDLVYSALVGGAARLFLAGADGGSPVAVTDRPAFRPAIDADGRRIAFYYTDEAGRHRVGMVPRSGGAPIWSAPAEPPTNYSRLVLRDDGLYLNTMPGDRGNVWHMPLDGSAPKKVTAFDDYLLFDFAMSDDGRTLAVARGPLVRDALLIRGFTGAPERTARS
jgi:serine/threonine protein kinase/Tol biopolymer transport system component